MTGPRRNGGEATPWWFTLIIVLAILPMFVSLAVAGRSPRGSELYFLSWLFPVYSLLSGFCAWMCYTDRRALAWILVCLMILSDLGMYALL